MKRLLFAVLLLAGCKTAEIPSTTTENPNFWPVGSKLRADDGRVYTLIERADKFEYGKPVSTGIWIREGSTRQYRTGILPKEYSAATMVLVPGS